MSGDTFEQNAPQQKSASVVPSATPPLEQIAQQEATPHVAATPTTTVTERVGAVGRMYLLPYDSYLTSFNKRFTTNSKFRDQVFDYLKLTKSERFKLSLGKTFMPGWYGRKMHSIIETYAQDIYAKTKAAYDVEQQRYAVAAKFREASQTASKIQDVAIQKSRLERNLSDVAYELEVEQQKETTQAQQDITIANDEKKTAIAKIKADTNVDNFISEKIIANLRKSELFVENSHGQITFNDDKMVMRLEDVLLRQTISEMQTNGDNSYLSRVESAYGEFLDRMDTAESEGEVGLADWDSSIMIGLSEGYRRPLLRHMIVPKYDQAQVGDISMSTLMAFDYSGSMRDNNRWQVAKQTGGAVRALTRKLTKKEEQNNLFVFHNDTGYAVSPKQFQQLSSPDGGTPMHLALDWLLKTGKEQIGKNSSVIAYLFSDGAPDDVTSAVTYASRFKDTGILLRLFLVDANQNTREIYRQIGKAAGPLTRIASVSNYQVAGGALKDLEKSISELKNVDSF